MGEAAAETNSWGCSFVEKVRNAEEAGAGLAIIVDNIEEEDVKFVEMVDDGSGAGLRIPSLLIGRDDGAKLREFLASCSPEEAENVLLLAEFDIKAADGVVYYDVWYSAPNDMALDFFQDFAPIDQRFGARVRMTPHFIFWECSDCDEDFKAFHCYRNGQYCAISTTYLTGQEIIQEDLR